MQKRNTFICIRYRIFISINPIKVIRVVPIYTLENIYDWIITIFTKEIEKQICQFIILDFLINWDELPWFNLSTRASCLTRKFENSYMHDMAE